MDEATEAPPAPALSIELHRQFVKKHESRPQDFAYWMTEHMHVTGLYYGVACSHLLGEPDLLDRASLLQRIHACRNADGGYAGNVGHDSHILHTYSALQVLAMTGEPTAVFPASDESCSGNSLSSLVEYVKRLQRPDGSFAGDEFGEVDTRFVYAALGSLALVERLDAVDTDAAAAYVLACMNADGGFGLRPGAESHAGQTFCCIAALILCGALHRINVDLLGDWLAERQSAVNGGLNGRPEKQSDSCYTWWVGATLRLIGKADRLNVPALADFNLRLQTPKGGFSAHPGENPDLFHTHFALAGLAALGPYENSNNSSVSALAALPRWSCLFCMPPATLPPAVQAQFGGL
eukprot:m.41332 g.41332  ORF g.41332 m.41332 type:complete len:350 (-) comp11993_c0_seq1:265-1314(-)